MQFRIFSSIQEISDYVVNGIIDVFNSIRNLSFRDFVNVTRIQKIIGGFFLVNDSIEQKVKE